MKAFFEKFGEVEKVTIIRDPSTHASRRFGFITMARVEDAVRAVTEMEVGQIDGFDVKCQRAKRKQAYEKTPGQCSYRHMAVFREEILIVSCRVFRSGSSWLEFQIDSRAKR